MNSKFTDKQIKAYAAQFREGDAIWSGGKWNEVAKVKLWKGDTRIGANVIGNNRIINFGKEWHKPYKGVESGFTIWDSDSNRCDNPYRGVENPYRVTTLEHYELQGGEKIVWLGASDDFRTFGKSYEVEKEKRYYSDDGFSLFSLSVTNNLWGIIPRYEQVSNQEPLPYGEELEQEMKRGLEHVVHYPTVADREEEVLRLKTFEKLTNGVDVKYIVDELKGIMEFALNNGDYNVAIGAIELIKEWEEMK